MLALLIFTVANAYSQNACKQAFNVAGNAGGAYLGVAACPKAPTPRTGACIATVTTVVSSAANRVGDRVCTPRREPKSDAGAKRDSNARAGKPANGRSGMTY